MQELAAGEELSVPKSIVTDRIAAARLIVGLLQGAALYFLYIAVQNNVWPATDRHVFAPLLLIWVFVPVILISGLGHLDAKRLALWGVTATLFAGALGFYDFWRAGEQANSWYGSTHGRWSALPSPLVFFFTGLGFYIAHALILAAVADKRRIARYPSYFEIAWKLAIQVNFSSLFVQVLWLILWLGASLFMLVKLNFLKDLLEKSWFFIPITAFAFACAFHITDVRPGIVRGIRTLLLVLMSWLLPITTLIVAGFLASLLWTGLAPLWATRHATAVLLGAAAVLVVLINAAFQNGEIGPHVARVLRISARIAAALLLPITLIAIYSLGLRVQEYGWTSDRVIAAACLLVASCYALGYAWAVIGRDGWLSRIAPANIITAFVILAVLLSLFSPLADPARLSVANQVARLELGKVSAAKFDFDYLKFNGARYGIEALQKLKAETQGPDAGAIREKAEASLRKEQRSAQANTGSNATTVNEIAANVTVWPKASVLPPSFFGQNWAGVKERWLLPDCLTLKDKKCDAYLVDFSGDGNAEILFMGPPVSTPVVFMRTSRGAWEIVGTLPSPLVRCKETPQLLAGGTYRIVPPLLHDLEIAGQRLHVVPQTTFAVKCDTLAMQ